jgi:hypothetical protein
MYNTRLYEVNVVIQVCGYVGMLSSEPLSQPSQPPKPKDVRATFWCHVPRLLGLLVCNNPLLTLRDDRTVYLLHAESANGFLFTYDTSFPCLFNQRSLVVCCPLLLVALEVRHSEPGAFEDKRDHHEDQAEDQREAQLVGGVL